MCDELLFSVRNATNLKEIADCVYQIIERDGIYNFSEYLLDEKINSLKNSEFYGIYQLLLLFAYGTYGEFITNQNNLPMLTDRMKWKLRQLTFISLCARQRIIPLKLAMDELHLPRIEDFEKFYISCIEDGIIKGFWDGEAGVITIKWCENRDVADASLDAIQQDIRKLIKRCETIKLYLMENTKENIEKQSNTGPNQSESRMDVET
ncbi:unnamed protein product [Dracunculus medinensis]|uniref:PCI domain-containing protein n=1 Tax=Dracunculus medinensis TaxID=318479 RepID=A0A0N4U7F6_DRAME|nr:unnamed protein product [Dracunculus medinensis]